ncbi:hypothetical protein E3O06_01730 [Cryobacterium glaciale]|uniref:Uncharacterized protein n=1 Tax=Cryobacterium glaciale TaxID=1259145 RepID=A0A4R8V4L3_9MICO|nr:hypothetical protein [Cryobacterium glaciale]TFB76135.1 hypothetical protein E3O06_01730 [Cryobacterium glaciale]
MILKASSITDRPHRYVTRSTIVAVVAMAAMLLGLLAIHSAGDEQEVGVAASTALIHADSPSSRDASAAGGVAADTAAVHAVNGSFIRGEIGTLGCALMAMVCVVLLILATRVLPDRLPAEYDRLLDAGGRLADAVYNAPLHIHRPSLTVLSISRT